MRLGARVANSGPLYLNPSTDLAYSCRARLPELLTLTWSQVSDQTFIARSLKDWRDTPMLFSARLKATNDVCKAKPGHGLGDASTLRTWADAAILISKFRSGWQLHMTRRCKAGNQRIRYRNLKAKNALTFED